MQTFTNVKKAFMENIFFRPRQPYMQTLYVYMYTLFAAYRIKGNKAWKLWSIFFIIIKNST